MRAGVPLVYHAKVWLKASGLINCKPTLVFCREWGYHAMRMVDRTLTMKSSKCNPRNIATQMTVARPNRIENNVITPIVQIIQ